MPGALPKLDGSPVQTDDPLLLAVNAFYAAFNERNITAMEQVWASEGILHNPIGGIARGWSEIRKIYERLFSGRIRVRVEFIDYSVHETRDAAFVAGRERGTARRENRTLDLTIRTTRIFEKLHGPWKQIHHHGSIDDPSMLSEYQALLRR